MEFDGVYAGIPHTQLRFSGAYIDAVYSVLTGKKGGPEAAADLEKQLISLTGFRAGRPRTDNTVRKGE